MVEQDEGCGDDVAQAPGAAAVAAQDLVGGLEEGVGSFAEAAQGAVDGVVALLVDGQILAGGLLDRDLEGVGFAFVAEVGQGRSTVVDPCRGRTRSLRATGIQDSSTRVRVLTGGHTGQAVASWGTLPCWRIRMALPNGSRRPKSVP